MRTAYTIIGTLAWQLPRREHGTWHFEIRPDFRAGLRAVESRMEFLPSPLFFGISLKSSVIAITTARIPKDCRSQLTHFRTWLASPPRQKWIASQSPAEKL
jgi:hypothetical protein